MKEILYLGIFLALVAAIAGSMLSITYNSTFQRIEDIKAQELRNSLKTIIPEADIFIEKDTGRYIGYRGSLEVGEARKAKVKGYASYIELLVGIDKYGKISGTQILYIRETPGLGQNADDQKFLSQFKGKTVDDKLKAKEDVAAIAGATITSQAIADGIRLALEQFKGSAGRRK